MVNKLFVELFQPKYPRRYTGRHRAPWEPWQLGRATARRGA